MKRIIYISLLIFSTINLKSQSYKGLVNFSNRTCFGEVRLKNLTMNEENCQTITLNHLKSWAYDKTNNRLFFLNGTQISSVDLNESNPSLVSITLGNNIRFIKYDFQNQIAYFFKCDEITPFNSYFKKGILCQINLNNGLIKELFTTNILINVVSNIFPSCGKATITPRVGKSMTLENVQSTAEIIPNEKLLIFCITDTFGTNKIFHYNFETKTAESFDMPKNIFYQDFEFIPDNNMLKVYALKKNKDNADTVMITIADYNLTTNTIESPNYWNRYRINTLGTFTGDGLIRYNPNDNKIYLFKTESTFSNLQKWSTFDIDNKFISTLNVSVQSPLKVDVDFRLPVSLSTLNYAKDDFKIFPTIVENDIEIESTTPIQSIHIYNTLGEQLYNSQAINKNTITINTSDYLKGIYFVECIINNKKITKKIIKA